MEKDFEDYVRETEKMFGERERAINKQQQEFEKYSSEKLSEIENKSRDFDRQQREFFERMELERKKDEKIANDRETVMM